MQKKAFPVIWGGLDWEGLSVSQDKNTLVVEPGVVGNSDNPLHSGGWTFTGATIELQPNDETVEVILYDDDVCLLVRSGDPNETFPEELNTLFLLSWKEDGMWVCHYPKRGSQYGEDIPKRKHHSHYTGTISFNR